MPSVNTTVPSLDDLRAEIDGQVFAPGDDGYDAARVVMLGGVDVRPVVIVRVAGVADVARVVGLARDTGLPLAVRSGGHSSAAHSTAAGGIVLDLRGLTALDIDVEARTAWAESGLTAAQFTAAAAEHGLAVGFGDTGSVGLGGLVLGGGVGFLARKLGLTIDSLLAAEIVTADGQLRHVDDETDPELFWALRGGGGNFGVVTRFKFALQPLPRVVGGLFVLPATVESVAGFIAAAEAAPEELTTIANVMNCPPLPMVAEQYHGTLVNMAFICFAGDAEAGEKALAPFRALGTPLADFVQPMPYPGMYPPEDPDYHPLAVSRTMFIDQVDDDVAAMIIQRLESSDAPLRAVQLRVLGGAVASVAGDATAYAHRQSRIMVNVASFYEGPDHLARRTAWVEDFADALRQSDAGAYVNFLADEGEDRVRAAYPPETWERLAAVKGRVDPDNLFRRNQNIRPAGTAA